MIEGKINAHTRRMFVGKPEQKRPLGRGRRKWVGYITMDCRMG
jgi:hypothetical protein